MKIKITEIEASAEDLRQSNTLADGLTRMMRNAFNPYNFSTETDIEEGTDDDSQIDSED